MAVVACQSFQYLSQILGNNKALSNFRYQNSLYLTHFSPVLHFYTL